MTWIDDQIDGDKRGIGEKVLEQPLFKMPKSETDFQRRFGVNQIRRIRQEGNAQRHGHHGNGAESQKQERQRHQRACHRFQHSQKFEKDKFLVRRNDILKDAHRERNRQICRQQEHQYTGNFILACRQSFVEYQFEIEGQKQSAGERDESDDGKDNQKQTVQLVYRFPVVLFFITGKVADIAAVETQAQHGEHGNGGRNRAV